MTRIERRLGAGLLVAFGLTMIISGQIFMESGNPAMGMFLWAVAIVEFAIARYILVGKEKYPWM